MQNSKAEWLQAEQNFDATHFKPSAEEREQLLSYLDAWDKLMAEQEKLMPMVDRLVATGDIAQIEAAARWMNNTGHAGRYHLIREWRRLSEAPTTTA